MIYIYQNKVNNIVTRFFDRKSRSDTFFLWEITNEVSNLTTYFITEDTSSFGCSYSSFSLEHSISGSKEGGINTTLDLVPGHNTYTVYETTEFSLDMQYVIGEIEKDIMFVELIRGVNTEDSEITNIYY